METNVLSESNSNRTGLPLGINLGKFIAHTGHVLPLWRTSFPRAGNVVPTSYRLPLTKC